MESMSLSPFLIPRAKTGLQLGHTELVDSIITDGLWDVYNDKHMGSCAETCVRKYQFTREEQDEFARESYTRAQNAQRDGAFAKEIVPVQIKDRKGNLSELTEDDEPQRANFEKMTKIRPAFEKGGTVTAANASKINDGAAAVVMMSAEKAADLGVKTVARVVAQASFSQEPEWFTTAPVGAIRKVLDKSGLTVDDINLFEINEAFAAVTMAAEKDLGLDHDKVNIYGGAVALGHPIGASGARILVTLLNAMESRKAKLGLATLCIGGGEASAVIVERV
jgi:acetyl-CoA C-acetyltransferase